MADTESSIREKIAIVATLALAGIGVYKLLKMFSNEIGRTIRHFKEPKTEKVKEVLKED